MFSRAIFPIFSHDIFRGNGTPLQYTDYTKAFDSVDHSKLWKILKELGIPDHLTSCETCMQVKKSELEPGMEEQTDSN